MSTLKEIAGDALHDAVQAYFDPYQDIQPEEAKRKMREALIVYEAALSALEKLAEGK